MIAYWDTSALVKLYVDEMYSDQVRTTFQQSSSQVCHAIGYVECLATLARLNRENTLSQAIFASIRQTFITQWPHFIRLPASAALLERAAELAEAFALRAYDSVHLAAADQAARTVGEPITFASYDKQLNYAARILGMTLLPGAPAARRY